MAFDLATAFLKLDGPCAAGALGGVEKMTGKVQGMAKVPVGALAEEVQPPRRRLTGMPASLLGLAALAGKMQQEAARQDMDRQKLAAQQEANEHLEALAGAAAGAGLRVQVVGNQRGQW